jgi:hypothetical protein
LDYEPKYNKNSAKKVKKLEANKRKEEDLNIPSENPLMATNKYYFLK